MIDTKLFNPVTLREALLRLNQVSRLDAHPLVLCRFVIQRLPEHAQGAHSRGRALQAALLEAIASLKPAGPPDLNEHEWRNYFILHEQYIKGHKTFSVAAQLYIQEPTYHQERKRAVLRLLSLLVEWERTCILSLSKDASEANNAPSIFLAPHQAPAKMIGRDALLAELIARLCAGQDVAVHGLPGMGKTTFAAAVANAPGVLDHFGDGVLWAGLSQPEAGEASSGAPAPAGAKEASDVLTALGQWLVALGRPQGELYYLATVEARRSAVQAAIGLRRMLIVIDDAWTTDPSTGRRSSLDGSGCLALRVGGPNCAHLFTSRLPQVADEAVGTSTPLTALSEADATQLLAQLAPEAAQRHADDLRAFETAAGGLPLALTLMGQALRTAERGSPRRLKETLAALRTPEGRLKLRQYDARLSTNQASTLREIISLSERPLDEPTRRAFHALGVFPPTPNTFSEEAALAIAGCTTDDLDALVDNGLIEVIAGRYGVHPVMRDYGRSFTSDLPLDRMLAFYFSAIGEHQRNHVFFDLELHNLTAALDLASERGKFDYIIKTSVVLFSYFETRGLYASAELWAKRALTAAQAAHDKNCEAWSYLHQGRIALKYSDLLSASRFFEHGISLAQQVNDETLIARFLMNIGDVLEQSGDLLNAHARYVEGLAVAKRAQNASAECELILKMASLAQQRGEFDDAATLSKQGCALAERIESKWLLSAHLATWAIASLKLGDFETGSGKIEAAHQLAKEINHAELLCTILFVKSVECLRIGNVSEAHVLVGEGSLLATRIGYTRLKNLLQAARAILSARQFKISTAIGEFAEATAAARESGSKYDLAAILSLAGIVQYHLNADDHATAALTEVHEISTQFGYRESVAIANYYMALIAGKQGRVEDALRLAQLALDQCETLRYWQTGEIRSYLTKLLENSSGTAIH